MFNFSPETLRRAITFLIALILSTAFHEFGHAFVADRLGDRLPRSQGRLTLNPIAHIDLVGTIILPLVMALTSASLLGWGKPVMTNPLAYTRRLRMKVGHLLVAAAGPVMNLVLALITSAIVVIYYRVAPKPYSDAFLQNAGLLIQLNFVLMFFNLLPLPPLDGGTVLRGLLPDRYDRILEPLERYGWVILLALVATQMLSLLLTPVYHIIETWFAFLRGFQK